MCLPRCIHIGKRIAHHRVLFFNQCCMYFYPFTVCIFKFLHHLIKLQTNNKHVARIFMEWWISSYKNPFDQKCIPLFTGFILINKRNSKKKYFKRIWTKCCPKQARDSIQNSSGIDRPLALPKLADPTFSAEPSADYRPEHSNVLSEICLQWSKRLVPKTRPHLSDMILKSNLFQNRHRHTFTSYFPPTFEFLNSLLSWFWLSKCV